MKTILLTGASGFVGTNFILDLHTKFRIIALVRQNSDVKIIENKCEILRYGDDIYQTLDEICGEIDGVIHLATKWLSSHTPEDIKDIIDANILLGTYILEAVKRHRVAFFINATSFGVYCNSNRYRPATLYAASKRAFEDIIKYYALVAKNTTFCNLLIFNTFGLYDKTPRLFNLLDKVALNGDELDMSDGIQIVDYTHIKNVVFGFECLINLVLEKPSFCKNKLFTLQSPNRRSLRELVALYERLLGKKLHINWGKRAKRELEITQPFSGGVRLPNWREKVSLEAGLSELIARNVKNRKVSEVCTAKNSAVKNHTAKTPNAKNRKWGGAESSNTLQPRHYERSEVIHKNTKSSDKKDLLYGLTRLDKVKSRNDDSALTVFARLCKKPKQSIESYKKQKDSAESVESNSILECYDSAMDCHENPADFLAMTKKKWIATRLKPLAMTILLYHHYERSEVIHKNTESSDKKDLLYGLPRLEAIAESRNDDSTLTVFARLCKKPKQSIESYKKQKDSAESSDFIVLDCHENPADFLAMTKKKWIATRLKPLAMTILLYHHYERSEVIHKNTKSSDKKDLLYGLTRLDKVKSRNDDSALTVFARLCKKPKQSNKRKITKSTQIFSQNHKAILFILSENYKFISGLPPMTTLIRFHAKIAESRNDKLNSDSTAIFTRKLHKSHTLKAVA